MARIWKISWEHVGADGSCSFVPHVGLSAPKYDVYQVGIPDGNPLVQGSFERRNLSTAGYTSLLGYDDFYRDHTSV